MSVKLAVAILALASATAAQAAEKSCIPAADAEALAIVLLPDAVSAVGTKCAATLPATATLRGGTGPLVARWRAEGSGLEASAARALGAMMSGDTFGSELKGGDPAAMLSLVRTVVVNGLVKDVKPASCADIDRALTLVSPLPARNIAGLFVMALQSGAAGKESGDFPICKVAKP